MPSERESFTYELHLPPTIDTLHHGYDITAETDNLHPHNSPVTPWAPHGRPP